MFEPIAHKCQLVVESTQLHHLPKAGCKRDPPLEKGRHVVRHEVGDAQAVQLVVPRVGPNQPFRRRP